MNLKEKSKILSVLAKISTFITALFLSFIFLLPKNSFFSYAFVLLLLCILTLIISNDIFDENYFYEHCLKATSEKKLLKKGFEYTVTPLYFDFYIETIEVDGERVNYTEDKKKFKKMLEQNDKVTVFCHLTNQDRWVFWSISNKEKRGSREQLVSFELPSKKLLKKLKKKKKPCIDRKINALCIRNKYTIYPNFVFIPQNVTSDPDCCKLLEQIKKDGNPITLARAILSEDVPLFSRKFLPRKRLSINTQSNYMVRRDSCTVPFEDTWNPLVFSGNGCALACFQEDGCKCCITPDSQKNSRDTCTKILKREQTHEVNFDDKTKNPLIDRIELIDQKLKDGFLFRNIHASKWESVYKEQILHTLHSPYPLGEQVAEMLEAIIEDLEENLYDAKKEADDLTKECTAKAMEAMLVMDGIRADLFSENKGEKDDFRN